MIVYNSVWENLSLIDSICGNQYIYMYINENIFIYINTIFISFLH